MTSSNVESLLHKHLCFLGQILTQSELPHVHMFLHTRPDYPRLAFLAASLARYIATFPDTQCIITQERVRSLMNNILTATYASPTQSQHNRRYVELYGMRCRQYLGDSYNDLIEHFSSGTYNDIFAYPITTQTFVTTYIQCPDLAKCFPFAETLYTAALDITEYILYSSAHERFRSFHYAELSAWGDALSPSALAQAREHISIKLASEISRPTTHASGLAKVLEHATRIGDFTLEHTCINALFERSYARFGTFMSPTFSPFAATLFTETLHSQYICLDTSAHIIHAACNKQSYAR